MNLQINEKKGLSHIMEILCTVFQVLGVLTIGSLPWTLNYYLLFKQKYVESKLYYTMMVLLICSGICAFFILSQAKVVLRNINKKDPFTFETANRIKYISYLCLPVAFAYIAAIFFIPSALTILVGLTFLFLSACIFIIAQLFYQAVRYKQENDLTI